LTGRYRAEAIARPADNRQKLFDPPRILGDNPDSIQ
jgi:hypothetical protein